jgi:hypothetical protein
MGITPEDDRETKNNPVNMAMVPQTHIAVRIRSESSIFRFIRKSSR